MTVATGRAKGGSGRAWIRVVGMLLGMLLLCLSVGWSAPMRARAAESGLAALEAAIAEAREQKAVIEAVMRRLNEKKAAAGEAAKDGQSALRAPAGFLRETTVTVNDELRLHLVEHFNPLAPPDAAWEVVTVEPPTRGRKRKSPHRGADGTFVMYAYTVSALEAAEATPVRPPPDGEEGIAYFHFPKAPEGLLQGDGAAFAERLTLLVGVDARSAEPFVRELRLVLEAPTRIKLIAKVKGFTWQIRYRRLVPERTVYVPERMITDAHFKIVFRGNERTHTEVAYRDYTPRSAERGNPSP